MKQEETLKLLEFVEAAKSKGASDEFLASFLARQGWPRDDIHAALCKYWEVETGLAVPQCSGGGESSRDAFLYLLSFSTLATWTSALGSMLFQFIDRWIPDPVTTDQIYSVRTAVTWQMASIAVAFPIFLLVMRTILREARERPERLQSGVRKWLTYIALLLTAGAMICDLIWFLDYFLTGELTSRFVLKALTVMLLCGAVFVYYLGSLHWDRDTNITDATKRSATFGMGAAAVVVAAFSIGLGVAGTPAVQRGMQADHRRIQDLRAITWGVHAWYQRAGRSAEPLPASLPELVAKGISQSQTADPQTGRQYEYRVKTGTGYELCAAFSGRQEEDQVRQTQFWYHAKGRTCFTLDASTQPVW
ncbi:MAG: DUF5671 domain-containing protein [Candidatus Sulfopaludibacter sp.]|nr:DUF5671 domain-containing protein [Candidatus Sulfopaludibacter sp.]